MTFKTFNIAMIGPTDQVYSKQQDNQLTQNYYAYMSEDEPSLQGTPGSRLFVDYDTFGIDRGFHVFNEVLYQVSGIQLDRINSDQTRTNIGSIPGTGRCIFADDGIDMFIVTGGDVYRYNTSLTLLTDPDFESPTGVAYINRSFLYDGSGYRWVASEIGDGSDVQQRNYDEAASNPDDLVIPYTFEDRVYFFCLRSIEPWWNSDEGDPPFSPIDTAVIQKGTSAPYSVANSDRFIYFLGDDLNVYQLRSNQIRNIANPGINKEIAGFSETGDAIGFCFNLEGQDFYYITFPTGDKSYLYSETTNVWTSMTYSAANERHLASSYAYVYGKHLIADRRNGRVLEWDLDLNEDNGDVIQRRRILPRIDGAMLGEPGKRVQMSRFELLMQKGVGLATGQGEDPIIMVELSFDGGESWQTIQNLRFGRAGQFMQKVEAYAMDTFYEMTVRTTQTDPVLSNIRSAAIDLQLAGY